MKLSARNHFEGTVTDIKKGVVTAIVKLDIGGGNVITSSITKEAMDELNLKVGAKAVAVIKSSSVMIMT